MLDRIEKALDAALDDTLNAKGRSAAHVAGGLALIAGAMLLSAVVSYQESPKVDAKERAKLATLEKPEFQPSQKTFSAVWPPMFLLLTLSAVRIWNAPASPHRTRALGVWVGVQVLHAITMAVDVKQQTWKLVSNIATMLGGLAYAREAKEVDPPSAAIITPYVSWMAFANVLAAELWRKNIDRPDVH